MIGSSYGSWKLTVPAQKEVQSEVLKVQLEADLFQRALAKREKREGGVPDACSICIA